METFEGRELYNLIVEASMTVAPSYPLNESVESVTSSLIQVCDLKTWRKWPKDRAEIIRRTLEIPGLLEAEVVDPEHNRDAINAGHDQYTVRLSLRGGETRDVYTSGTRDGKSYGCWL